MPEQQFNPEELFKTEVKYKPDYDRIGEVFDAEYKKSGEKSGIDGRSYAVLRFYTTQLIAEIIQRYADLELVHKKEIFKAVYLPKLQLVEKAENGDIDALLNFLSGELVGELEDMVELEAKDNMFANASEDLANLFKEFSSNTRFFTAWSAAFNSTEEREELVLTSFVEVLGDLSKSAKNLEAVMSASDSFKGSQLKVLSPRLETIKQLCESLSFLQRLFYPIKSK